MKTSLILLCFVTVQLAQFSTEGQLIEIDVPKHMKNANKLYGRLVRGAHNLMSLPLARRSLKSESTKETTGLNFFHQAQAKAAEIKAFAGAKTGGWLNFLGAPLRMFYEDSHEGESTPNNIESWSPHGDSHGQGTHAQLILSGGSGGGWGQASQSSRPPFEFNDEGGWEPGFPPSRPGHSYDSSPSNSYNSIQHSYDAPPKNSYNSGPPSSYSQPSRPSNNPQSGWSSSSSQSSNGPPSRSPPQKPMPSYIRLSRPSSSGSSQNQGWSGPQQCESRPADRIRFFPGDVLPSGWELQDPFGNKLNPEDVNREGIPNPPVYIRIGIQEPLPANHSITYVERVEIIQPTGPSRSAFDIKMEAHYKGDKIPETRNSLLDINARPKLNTFQVVTRVVQAPNNSAPLNGYDDPEFTSGRNRRDMLVQNNRMAERPFQSQIRVLGEVFSQIQEIENGSTPPTRSAQQQHNANSFASSESEIEAPIIVLQLQKFTHGDPDSSEKIILDAYYNFGFPAYQVEFGDQHVIAESWELQKNNPQFVNVNQLGSSLPEISDTFRDWVRRYVMNGRKAVSESYHRAEAKAFEGFAQYQYFIVRPGECPIDLDPASLGASTSQACANGNTRSTGPPPAL